MLAPGTRLGPYEIVALVGEGGMGQVFKARDTRLDRVVAVKMLPAALAADPVRRERFEREAHSISHLEHPHICPLYDVGEHDGHPYLVMQFLEGETLADRLQGGALSIKQVLEHGVQVAEALAAAHRAGIVHRDLKPGNIMLTRTGVRLLDFGLARAAPGMTTGQTTAGHRVAPTHAALTTEGTILGTPSYMAPEQIDGREVDTRADIFAFGAVLFEMVTGLKAFEGESPARVISAILRDEPARVSSIAPVTPAALEALIHACLAKDPNERWQNVGDVARQLKHLRDMMSSGRSGVLPAAAVVPPPERGRQRGLAWAAATVAIAAIVALVGFATGRFGSAGVPGIGGARLPLRASILPPDGMYLTDTLALSPDGRQLAFVAADATGRQQLWVRALASGTAAPIEGTEGASDPFWSPDAAHVAFFADRQLKRVPASGGRVTAIAPVANAAGGSWSADGVIVFGRQDGPVMRVAADGGRAEPVTEFDRALEETHHLYPAFLPDGRRFVVYVNSRERGLYAMTLDGARTRLLDPAPDLPAGAAPTPGVYAGGRLLYVRDRTLLARRFDPDALEVSGEPVTVAETVDYDPPGQAAFTAVGGVLVYRARQHRPLAALAWIDRGGRPLGPVEMPAGSFRTMSLSPDGRTLAIDRRDAQGLPSVWLVDTADGSSTRVTADYWAGDPLWSPDGRVLAYSVAADSPPNLVVRDEQGAGPERRVTKELGEQHFATSFTPDGRQIVYQAVSAATGLDLYVVPVSGEAPRPQRLLQTAANEHSARISPDGRWVAYLSDQSGQTELYVARYPELTGTTAVSSGGAARPQWRRDGRELYFLAPGGRLMAVSWPPAAGAAPGGAVELFRTVLAGELYVPDAAGARFLVARPASSQEIVPLEIVVSPRP